MSNKIDTGRATAPDLAEIMQLLDYDAETGIFRWKKTMKMGKIESGAIAGWLTDTGYRIIGIGARRWRAHRLAWFYIHGEWPTSRIDHINGNTGDNRIINLREATHSQNIANSKSRRNILKGAYFDKRRKSWKSSITVNQCQKYLGIYATMELAHLAYMRAAVRYFGEFANSGV